MAETGNNFNYQANVLFGNMFITHQTSLYRKNIASQDSSHTSDLHTSLQQATRPKT